jgi:hypothetical protein
MSNSNISDNTTTATTAPLSQKAQEIIHRNHPNAQILYANESVHYDGFSEFGPEIEIAELHLILLNPSTTPTNRPPKYTYMTYHKEYLLGTETEPRHEIIQCIHRDIYDIAIFHHPWTDHDHDLK